MKQKLIGFLAGLFWMSAICAQTFPVNNLNVQGQLQLGGSPGTAGMFLQSNGSSAPTWGTAIAGGATNPSLNFLSSLTGAVSRTYTSKLSDLVSVKDFGAVGNGIANDGPAILAANSVSPVVIPAGIYLVSASITLPNAVTFMPGAQLSIASGQTVTFNGSLNAGVGQIFSGSGSVVISPAYTTTGYPEWWGGQANYASVDQSTFINTCISAMVVCKLQAGTYYTTGTILQQSNNKAVVGASPDFTGTGGSTIISNNSPSATIYQIGPNTYTGTMQNTNILKNVILLRSVAPQISSAPNGLLVQYTVWTSIDNVLSQDSVYAFHILGNANMFLTKDSADRSLAGSGGGTDKYYGFWLDASANIGFAGGNASVYIDRCSVGSTVTWTSSLNYQGLVATGTYGYSDIFVNYFSTANLGFGIDLVGNGNTSTTFDNQNEDVRIYNPVLDSNGFAGIEFNGTSLYGSIQVIGGYINFNGAGSTPVGLEYDSSNGSITVTGMEIMCQQSATAHAVVATGSKGIDQIGNDYFECKNWPIELNGTTHSRFEDRIRAYSLGSTNQPAIYIHNSSSRNIFKMSVEGASTAYSQGYYLSDSTTSFTEFDASGIDASAISGNKLNNNGTAITSVGSFGTSNYATGVMN